VQNVEPNAGTLVHFFKPLGATDSAIWAKGGVLQRSQSYYLLPAL